MAVVYKHIRKDTGEPFYIGIGKTEKRAHSKWGRNIFWKRITNFTEYSIEIIHSNVSWQEACELETYYIKLYGRKDLGLGILCNLTDGGEGHPNPTIETRNKNSKNQMGEKNHMWGKRGVETSMYGKKHTDEAKLKMSEKRKGCKLTEEHIQSIIKSNTGRKHTQEELNKMSISQLGEKNHMWGKNGSAVSNSKLNSEKVKWIRNNFVKGDIEFGIRAIARRFNVSKTTIMDVINYKLWKHL